MKTDTFKGTLIAQRQTTPSSVAPIKEKRPLPPFAKMLRRWRSSPSYQTAASFLG